MRLLKKGEGNLEEEKIMNKLDRFKKITASRLFFIAVLSVISLLLPLSVANADSKNGIDDISRGDYLPKAGLHIKTTANTGAVSLGIGYPGHKWRADCRADGGTSVNGNKKWFRARDIKTNVKGYSALFYMDWQYKPTFLYVSTSNTCIYIPNGK
jgi:hypothetical protein